MFHPDRRFAVSAEHDPEQLARKLTRQTWTGCTSVEHAGYLFLNDSTGPDAAQEYAVFKKEPGPSGKLVQIEGVTFSWMDEALRIESDELVDEPPVEAPEAFPARTREHAVANAAVQLRTDATRASLARLGHEGNEDAGEVAVTGTESGTEFWKRYGRTTKIWNFYAVRAFEKPSATSCHERLSEVVRGGIEPPTHGFSVREQTAGNTGKTGVFWARGGNSGGTWRTGGTRSARPAGPDSRLALPARTNQGRHRGDGARSPRARPGN